MPRLRTSKYVVSQHSTVKLVFHSLNYFCFVQDVNKTWQERKQCQTEFLWNAVGLFSPGEQSPIMYRKFAAVDALMGSSS